MNVGGEGKRGVEIAKIIRFPKQEIKGRRQKSFPACGRRQGTWRQRAPSRRFCQTHPLRNSPNCPHTLRPFSRLCH